MSRRRSSSGTNFLVGIHPSRRIRPFLPTKPSEVHTMLKGRCRKIVNAIFRSRKHEWFMRMRHGSSARRRSIPISRCRKCTAFSSDADAARTAARRSGSGCRGKNGIALGRESTFSYDMVSVLIFMGSPSFSICLSVTAVPRAFVSARGQVMEIFMPFRVTS